MKSLIESLSLGSGAVLIAFVSVWLVWLLCSVSRRLAFPAWSYWILVVVVPFGLSYCLYWSPVWLGSDPSEYGAWQVLCVGAWFLAGAVPSGIIAATIGKRPAA